MKVLESENIALETALQNMQDELKKAQDALSEEKKQSKLSKRAANAAESALHTSALQHAKAVAVLKEVNVIPRASAFAPHIARYLLTGYAFSPILQGNET